MNDQNKTKQALIKELEALRLHVSAMQEAEAHHHRRKNALRESENLYRTLIETSPDPIVMYDLQGKLITANQQAANIYGVPTVADLLTEVKTVFDLLTDEGRVHAEASFRKTLAEGTPQKNEYVVKIRGEKTITAEMHSSIVRSANGEPRAFISVVRDITDRKRVEESLKEAEERYRIMFESSPVGIVILDPDEIKIIEFNETAHRQLGYSRDEFARLNLSDIEASETPEMIRAHVSDIMKKGRHDFETRHRTRNGEIRDVYVTAQFTRTSGRPVYHCLWEDITAQKQAAEALSEARSRLGEIIEHLPDVTFVIDKDGRVTAWNKAMEHMTGVRARDILGKNNYEYALPFYGERRPILIDLVLKSSKKFEEKYVMMDRKGEVLEGEAYMPARGSGVVYLHGLASVLQDSKGNVVGAIEAIRDITDRKHAEEALKESEERFRILADSTPTAIMLYQDDRWIYVNRAAEDICGYSAKEILGMNFWDIVHPDYKKAIRDEGRKRQTGEKTLNRHEFKIISKDGTEKWVDLAGASTMLGGKLAGIISVIDITNRKRAEEEKEKLQAQLLQSQKMESVGRLAGGVAHDFNNMLNVISGHAEMAMRNLTQSEPVSHHILEISKAAQRSANLTKQLLAYARKQMVSPKVLDLNDEVEKMIKMLQRIIGENVRLEWRPAANLWWIKIDPSQIDQILANLCVNARDAISGVGQLKVATGNVTFDEYYCLDRIEFVPGEYVILSVSDSGCGMSKEILDNLFEPFFTTKGQAEGTGLGLATIYGIVKQNNGFIDVHSEVGRGSTFEIYLPRYAGREIQEIETLQQSARKGQETVLVVEDEPSILSLCKIILEDHGYRVLTAGSPHEAIRLCENHSEPIDLLVTDVVMPDMNGRDLAGRLHSLHPRMKHLFVSGYSASMIAGYGVLEENANFITKPFSVDELASAVRSVLDMKTRH